MAKVFQSLTAEKIQELLAICGVSDCDDEPIKQHILSISNFVREMRLQVGLTDAPPLLTPRASPNPEATANGQRGSYRFLPTPEKRSRADYTGLDGPSKKKRRNKVKVKNKNPAKDIVHEKHDVVTSRKGDTSVDPPLTTEAHAAITSSPHTKTTLPINTDAPRAANLPDIIIENILINCVNQNDPLGRYCKLSTVFVGGDLDPPADPRVGPPSVRGWFPLGTQQDNFISQ